MTGTYMIGIDQSTQGTKALLFDEKGALVRREDIPHHQIVNDMGWVSHDGEEIYTNTISVVERLIENSGIDRRLVAGVGIIRLVRLFFGQPVNQPGVHCSKT